MSQEVDQFKELIKPWQKAYSQIFISAMGIHEDGKDILLSGRLILAFGLDKFLAPMPLQSQIFWANSEVRAFSSADFDELITNLALGRLLIAEREVILTDEIQELGPAYIADFKSAIDDQTTPRLPKLIFTGRNKSDHLNKVIKMNELDWHLRSLTPPFSDLSDLYGYYNLLPGDLLTVEVVARHPAQIDARSLIHNGQAHVRILAPREIDCKEVSVGYRGFGGSGGMIRGRTTPELFAWFETNELAEGKAVIDVGDTATLQLFLSYAGTGVQQLWIIDPERHLNPRHAIHSAFDSDQSILKRLLFDSKKSDARDFEDGVAMLLGMLGFSITQYGRTKKLSDAPDLIAITPTGHAAVVECTIGFPEQGDQFSKILQRVETLRKSLAASKWPGIKILPLIFTSLSSSEIANSRQEAQEKGITVACRDDIEKMLIQANIPVDADKLFSAVSSSLVAQNILR
jgi:hypothetical protein